MISINYLFEFNDKEHSTNYGFGASQIYKHASNALVANPDNEELKKLQTTSKDAMHRWSMSKGNLKKVGSNIYTGETRIPIGTVSKTIPFNEKTGEFEGQSTILNTLKKQAIKHLNNKS